MCSRENVCRHICSTSTSTSTSTLAFGIYAHIIPFAAVAAASAGILLALPGCLGCSLMFTQVGWQLPSAGTAPLLAYCLRRPLFSLSLSLSVSLLLAVFRLRKFFCQRQFPMVLISERSRRRRRRRWRPSSFVADFGARVVYFLIGRHSYCCCYCC